MGTVRLDWRDNEYIISSDYIKRITLETKDMS